MNKIHVPSTPGDIPWNKGKLVGQKPPLKLRGCDLVRLRVRDVAHGAHVLSRGIVVQQKTRQPVRFELTEQTREAVAASIAEAKIGCCAISGSQRRPESKLL